MTVLLITFSENAKLLQLKLSLKNRNINQKQMASMEHFCTINKYLAKLLTGRILQCQALSDLSYRPMLSVMCVKCLCDWVTCSYIFISLFILIAVCSSKSIHP